MKALCDYGCGQRASFELRSGKRCCSPHVASCPDMRRRNSESKKGRNPWAGLDHPRGMAGKTAWNKGLTKATNASVKQGARKASKFRKLNPGVGFVRGSRHTAETRARISATMKATGSGGYRIGSGRGKKGWYKGIHCDSSWELAFVLWCELKGRAVKRAKRKFEYVYKKKTRKYLPDFRYLTPQGKWKYVEIKGYMSAQWKAKKKAFPHELLIVSWKTMSRVFLPVVEKHYGKDFTSLYESRVD